VDVIKKYIYIIFSILTAVILGSTLHASFTGTAGTADSIFMSPGIVFVFATFVAIQIICLFTTKTKINTYYIGFYLLHIGLVLFLAGCFAYYILGDKLPVDIPVDAVAKYNKIQRAEVKENESEFVELPFYIGLTSFEVERYESGADKHYEATLMVIPEGSSNVQRVSLTVNHPYRVDGWKIYLMDYNKITENTVTLLFKYDPAEYVSLTGLWMIIIGSVFMCLLRKKGGKCK